MKRSKVTEAQMMSIFVRQVDEGKSIEPGLPEGRALDPDALPLAEKEWRADTLRVEAPKATGGGEPAAQVAGGRTLEKLGIG